MSELSRRLASERLKTRWASPKHRAKMLADSERGRQRAAEVIKRCKPTPSDPAERRKFRYIREILGPKEARKAFGL